MGFSEHNQDSIHSSCSAAVSGGIVWRGWHCDGSGMDQGS